MEEIPITTDTQETANTTNFEPLKIEENEIN